MGGVIGLKRGFGGIAVFAHTTLAGVALLEYVEGGERMYCVLQSHVGAILLASWYRPPDDDGTSMNELLTEPQLLPSEVVGTIVLGDIKYSSPKIVARF